MRTARQRADADHLCSEQVVAYALSRRPNVRLVEVRIEQPLPFRFTEMNADL